METPKHYNYIFCICLHTNTLCVWPKFLISNSILCDLLPVTPGSHVTPEHLLQSITGQRGKLARTDEAGRDKWPHICWKSSRGSPQERCAPARRTHVHIQQRFSRGEYTPWGCQIQSHLVSTWLGVLSCFVTLLQIPSL